MTDPVVINGNGKKLVDNVVLTVLARFAMIAAAAMLPILGTVVLFMINRGVSSVDQVSQKIDSVQTDISKSREQAIETGGNVKLIQQTQQMQGAIIADHEARLRTQEGRPKPPPP